MTRQWNIKASQKKKESVRRKFYVNERSYLERGRGGCYDRIGCRYNPFCILSLELFMLLSTFCVLLKHEIGTKSIKARDEIEVYLTGPIYGCLEWNPKPNLRWRRSRK